MRRGKKIPDHARKSIILGWRVSSKSLARLVRLDRMAVINSGKRQTTALVVSISDEKSESSCEEKIYLILYMLFKRRQALFLRNLGNICKKFPKRISIIPFPLGGNVVTQSQRNFQMAKLIRKTKDKGNLRRGNKEIRLLYLLATQHIP